MSAKLIVAYTFRLSEEWEFVKTTDVTFTIHGVFLFFWRGNPTDRRLIFEVNGF